MFCNTAGRFLNPESVSQLFDRIVQRGRAKVARALCEGSALRIDRPDIERPWLLEGALDGHLTLSQVTRER